MSRLLNVLHKAGTVTLDGAGYTYDNAGNRTAKTNYLNNITEQYTYGPLYQLTQVTQGTTTTESYSYDAVGNRLSSLGMSPYVYNSSNELTSTPAATFTYDSNGNTLTKVDTSGTTTYNWDFENRLISVVLPTATVSFAYDAFGRRIQKSSSSGTTIYLYDSGNVTEEVDASGNLLARYAQGAVIDEPLAELRSGASVFYESDALGSITSLSSSTGAISNSYAYDAFGNAATATESFTNPYRYTARDYDPETGLQYSRARYYDSNVGRFVSEDPIRFAGSLSFYVYTQNRPIIAKDPSGLAIWICNRAAFNSEAMNHAFLYDDRNGNNCGMGVSGPQVTENIHAPGTFCTLVPGSTTLEDKVMSCCNGKARSWWWQIWWWTPFVHDCHNLASSCLTAAGLPDIGAPGGRFGCRGNCKPPLILKRPIVTSTR
ncbi:MAG TPA: RHS repeat-associated core domain-containing protein [Candidatus Angelobacter sp.]|nr:RHS repeat-associated core domain-containing protein [Candidatus Angelobacter sp.]